MSLIELVVVIIVVGAVAAVAVLKFSGSLLEHQATALARQIVMDIDTVRSVARASSTTKSLSFDTVNKTYTLNGVANPNRSSAAYVVAINDYSTGAAFGAIDLGGDKTLSFNGFGKPDSGGTIQITVGAVSKTIVVDADTGSATVP